MAEERMLNDEILLGLIKANSGGGGGGTSDYSQLTNKPQINGNTLTGNKTASQLGLASTADLAGKVDKAEGYGLSENDYTDAEKAIVGGVTAALAGKQDVLTAGNNIKIDDDTISVNRWAVPAGKVVYTVITSDENYGQNVHIQRHTLGGSFIDDRTFLCEMYKTVNIDGLISIYNPYSSFRITLLENSDEQQAGYNYTVNPITTPTSNSFTFMMEQEENDNDLIIREELDDVDDKITAIKDGQSIDSFADVETALAGKQATLTFDDTPTDNSNNPVKSNGIYDALALKQNATDNNLETTSKTVVGAVNELKSGLTNVNTALDVPAGTGKNLAFKMILKATINESGVIETNNAYNLFVAKVSNGETYTATKGSDYRVYAFYSTEPVIGSTSYDGSRVVESNTASSFTFTAPTSGYIAFRSVVAYTDGQLEKGSTATPYTPYIPSVDTRLETLTTEINKRYYYNTTHSIAMNGGYVEIDISGLSTGKAYLVMCCGKNNSVWRYAGVLCVLEANGSVLYDLIAAGSLSVSVAVGTYILKVTNNNAEHNHNINVKIIG